MSENKIITESKRVQEMTCPEYYRCLELNDYTDGACGFYLETIWKSWEYTYFKEYSHHFISEVVLAKMEVDIDDTPRKLIVGWALLQDLVFRYPGYVELMIYVDEDFRGKGIGDMLMRHIEEKYKQMMILCWPSEKKGNEGFFRKYYNHPFYLADINHWCATGELKMLSKLP